MAYSKSYRIYDGMCIKPSHGYKGKKKKVRRMMRAYACDGWARKRANGLRPQHETSKSTFRREYA